MKKGERRAEAASASRRAAYERLISHVRLRPSSVKDRTLNVEMLSDKARIVTSTAFRRLQTKAQVFSLERNAAVRTRLTHTLEVAMYGELIAEQTVALLRKTQSISPELSVAFVQAVENACLLHDIGNPPFGHLGEYAVKDWFTRSRTAVREYWEHAGMKQEDINTHYRAFEHFDGNAQGFRIITRLQWHTDALGFNFTCTLLGAVLKYLSPTPREGAPFGRKIGYFEAERIEVLEVWKTLGLPVEAGEPAQRHPIVFLMEAADDLAYCLSDIEDALEKRIVSHHTFITETTPLASFLPKPEETLGDVANNAWFVLFRTKLTRYLVEAAARAYAENEDAILTGRFRESLLDVDPIARQALECLKSFSRNHIFVSREAVEVELTGFRIVQEILSAFERLICLSTADFERLGVDGAHRPAPGQFALESRLYSLLSNKHRLAYRYMVNRRPDCEPAYRTHMIVDYVTGMTDGHAVKIYKMLSGAGVGATE